MTSPIDPENQGWAALVAAAIITGTGALWKLFFAFRNDKREDGKSQMIHGTYEELIDSLNDQLRAERELRKEVEEELVRVKRELRALRGGND